MNQSKSWHDIAKTKDKYIAIYPAEKGSSEWISSGQQEAQEILKLKKDGDLVLEYGCGTGRILDHLPGAHGVDIVSEFVKECNERNIPAWLVSEYPHKADLVFSLTVFIHMNKADSEVALEWIYDHLNEGGMAYIQAPIYQQEHDPNSWIDVGTWTREHFVKVCHRCGLEVLETNESSGSFSYDNIGKAHHKYQILKKPRKILL